MPIEIELTRQVGDGGSDFLVAALEEDSTLVGRGGRDILIGQAGDDILKGNRGSDQLFGGGGNDMLFGGSGRDFLSGGMGADILTGGNGADTFQVDLPFFLDVGIGVRSVEVSGIDDGFGDYVMPIFETDIITDFTSEDSLFFNFGDVIGVPLLVEDGDMDVGPTPFDSIEFVQDGDDVVILFTPGPIMPPDEWEVDALVVEVPHDGDVPCDGGDPISYELVRLLDVDLDTVLNADIEIGFGHIGGGDGLDS